MTDEKERPGLKAYTTQFFLDKKAMLWPRVEHNSSDLHTFRINGNFSIHEKPEVLIFLTLRQIREFSDLLARQVKAAEEDEKERQSMEPGEGNG